MLLKRSKQKNQLIPLLQISSQSLISQQLQPIHYSTTLLNPQRPISYYPILKQGFLKQNELYFGLDIIDQEQSSQQQTGLKQQQAIQLDQIYKQPKLKDQELRHQNYKVNKFHRMKEVIQKKQLNNNNRQQNILFKYTCKKDQKPKQKIKQKLKSWIHEQSEVQEIFSRKKIDQKQVIFQTSQKQQQILIKKPLDNSFLKSKFYSTLSKFKQFNVKEDQQSPSRDKKAQFRTSQRYSMSQAKNEKIYFSRTKAEKSYKVQKSQRSQKLQKSEEQFSLKSKVKAQERQIQVLKLQSVKPQPAKIQAEQVKDLKVEEKKSEDVKIQDEIKKQKNVISEFKTHIQKINIFKQNQKKRQIISSQDDIQQHLFNFTIDWAKNIKNNLNKKNQQQQSILNKPISILYAQTNKKPFSHRINESKKTKIQISYKTTLLQLKQLCLRQDKHQLIFQVQIPQILQNIFFTQFDSQKSIFQKANNIFSAFEINKQNVVSIKKYNNCIMIFSGKLLLLYYYSSHLYLGQWSQNKKNGIGLQWYPNKSVYYGQFLHGNRHGFGIINDKNSKTLVGLWSNNYFLY